MSIQTLKKATLVGLTEEKATLLDALQALGSLHIIPLQVGKKQATQQHEISPEQLHTVLHYLLSCQHKRRQVNSERHFDLASVTAEVEESRSRRLTLMERHDFLKKRIKDLAPWGSFLLPEEGQLYGQRFWFYLVPNYRMKEVEKTDLIWELVHRDNRYSYVTVISADEPHLNAMPVTRTHTGAVPLHQLENELEDIAIELESIEAGREALTRWIYLLQRSVAGTEDSAQLNEVADQSLDGGEVFALQGWVAEKDIAQLSDFVEQNSMVLQLADPDADELPPTLLDNPVSVAGGEEVVNFFQMPGYRSWDPSRVVFFSFVSFFALIMSDAGYSLLLGGLVFFYWEKMGRTLSGKRLRSMGIALTAAGTFWGVVVGSYFGAPPPLEILAACKLMDLNDFDSMMLLSISIGTGHLILANLIMAWVRRKSLQALSAVGWALAVAAALWGWLQGMNALNIGLFIIGLLLVLLYSAPAADKGWKRLFSGVLALTGVTKIFGDVLSYLRLFALGLASASLAVTFNQLAVDVAVALPGIGLLLKVLILLVGHLLNFALTVISGVIHGLRLNLIEFYNWSLADEGYAFLPFAKREVSPWIT